MNTHPWKIIENKIDKKDVGLHETLYALGNGNIGVRGFFEEDNDGSKELFMNAFYETSPIVYGEDHYGNPHTMETMVCLPNSLRVCLEIDGESVQQFSNSTSEYNASLHFQSGISSREYVYTTSSGAKFLVSFERLVSFVHESTIVQNITIKALKGTGHIALKSYTNEKHIDIVDGHDPRVSSVGSSVFSTIEKVDTDGSCLLQTKTTEAGHHLLIASSIESNMDNLDTNWIEDTFVSNYEATLHEGTEVVFTKYISYVCTKNYSEQDLLDIGKDKHTSAASLSWAEHCAIQKEKLTAFWNKSDVIIEGDDESQQAIRFNLFQMFGSVGKHQHQNIAAKGLTGKGYGGHYFWDTETYIFPFFAYTNPEIAQNLLLYRAGILSKAKERAAELGFKGALFPWRTISGRECSAYYPAGTAQIHINADIMNAVGIYGKVTNDYDFIYKNTVPMLVEMARFYADYSDFIPNRGYCFNGVTGPDEYTTMVNNNAYTNYMIRSGFRLLLNVLSKMEGENHTLWTEWKESLMISDEELTEWKNIEENIYLPKFNDGEIIPQDDTFLDKKEWDFEGTPKENYPLLLNYHPMVIYKHQVLKQADLLLSFVWLPEEFSDKTVENNYHFYEKRTTHDSSLSYCMHSVVAYRIGDVEEGWNYLNKTFRLDLDNTHHNTEHGLHMACMGGSWLNLFYGVAGMNLSNNGDVTFNPQLPEKWKKLSFRFTTSGIQKEVTITHNSVTVTIL